MSLTLTITDPHNLTEAERLAVLTFCGVRVEQRSADKIAGARNEPRDSVREVLEQARAAEALGIPARIDPADDPSAGRIPVPPVPSLTAAVAPIGTTEQRDFSAIFGGAPAQQGATAAPSVPVPPGVPTIPSPGPAIPVASGSPSPAVGTTAAPAVPSAASATVAASVPPAGGSDVPAAPPNPSNALDSAGMPWDHRIHATTKTKNADGTWRQKRGVDGALIAEVTEQNKRLMAIAPPAVPPAPAGAPPVPVAAPTSMTFPELMDQVIKLINSGKLSLEAANAACLPMGVTQLHQLDKRPDLIDAAWAHLRAAAGVA